MKILLISYDYFKYDGRLRELIKVAKELGEVTYITRSSDGEEPQEQAHILYPDRGYVDFIRFVCRQVKRIGNMDLIFIDNRKGIIPGYLAKKLTNASYVVQDCRELYNMKSAAGIPGKIGCIVEKIFTQHSDVVIAANAYRAKLMVKMFGLKKKPLNYENIRRLEYTSEERKKLVEEECASFFSEKKFRIISTAGCDMSRTTGKMLEAMKGLGEDYELLLIGESDEEDELIVRQTIQDLKLTNVKILPRMDQDHLKYFIQNSQVGWVAYHQRDLNNKYCASGKIYEFLFEGVPVVTSTNPPLKEFCEKYKVGQASDDYEQAVRAIAAQEDRWKASVRHFVERVHVENNNHRLAEQIRRELGA
jgi:glycosyltransferase involved in cell wall biosynthesis